MAGRNTPPRNKRKKVIKTTMMNNTNKQSFLLVAAMLLIGLLTGCLKDDLSHCPRPFQVTIKAFDADRIDITESGDVQQVLLFVFDENEQIFETYTLSGQEVIQRKAVDIQLRYPISKLFKFIAWANLDENVDYSDITTIKDLSNLYVKLRSRSNRSGTSMIAESPGDLFYGSLDVATPIGYKEEGQLHVIEIFRATVGETITAIDVKQWNEGKEGEYSFIVRETYDMYDSEGNMIGDKVTYEPKCTLLENGTLSCPIFYVFPLEPGKGYVIDILFNGEVIFTADSNSDGTPFYCEKGCTINIIIDFRANLHILTEITPWNVVFQYVDFN